jgi:uncharacterized sporulation protein YeaH/YhbH (DUF444 family)
MSIIDRRKSAKYTDNLSRRKFIERQKRYLQDKVEDLITKGDLKDLVKGKEKTIKAPHDTIKEPVWNYEPGEGVYRGIRSGNDKFSKRDKIKVPKGSAGGGSGNGAGDSAEGEDDFEFILSHQEFVDLYFDRIRLPNFMKKGIKKLVRMNRKRAGFCRKSIPVNLDVKKTFFEKKKRTIPFKGSIKSSIEELQKAYEEEVDKKKKAILLEEIELLKKKKPAYLTDHDLSYRRFVTKPEPIKHAVVFLLMDVSGSLGQKEKTISKHFFYLFLLFLSREYKNIDIRFIRHHSTAEEVDEHTFFYGRDTGGTLISTGFQLINDIIEKDYDSDSSNIYIAYTGDGENWNSDNPRVYSLLRNNLMEKIQFLAYLNIGRGTGHVSFGPNFIHQVQSLKEIYNDKIGTSVATGLHDVYKGFRELFEEK